MAAGAAAGHKDVDAAGAPERTEGSGGKLIAKVFINRDRLSDRGGMHPSRIGVLLVLPPDLHGHVIFDGSQA